MQALHGEVDNAQRALLTAEADFSVRSNEWQSLKSRPATSAEKTAKAARVLKESEAIERLKARRNECTRSWATAKAVLARAIKEAVAAGWTRPRIPRKTAPAPSVRAASTSAVAASTVTAPTLSLVTPSSSALSILEVPALGYYELPVPAPLSSSAPPRPMPFFHHVVTRPSATLYVLVAHYHHWATLQMQRQSFDSQANFDRKLRQAKADSKQWMDWVMRGQSSERCDLSLCL